jgi:hypothetical protein
MYLFQQVTIGKGAGNPAERQESATRIPDLRVLNGILTARERPRVDVRRAVAPPSPRADGRRDRAFAIRIRAVRCRARHEIRHGAVPAIQPGLPSFPGERDAARCPDTARPCRSGKSTVIPCPRSCRPIPGTRHCAHVPHIGRAGRSFNPHRLTNPSPRGPGPYKPFPRRSPLRGRIDPKATPFALRTGLLQDVPPQEPTPWAKAPDPEPFALRTGLLQNVPP